MSAGRLVAAAAIVLFGLTACEEGPPSSGAEDGIGLGDRSSVEMPANLPVKEIMQGLEHDMAMIAHGIWLDDSKVVAQGAGGVADHPKATPDQVGVIQSALGNEFASFVQLDQTVHRLATQLANDAAASVPISELFDGYVQVQEGCTACHTQFRSRVSEALAESSAGP